MVSFTIKLAEVPIYVRALHASTKLFCSSYLTREEPTLRIAVNQTDIDSERERYARIRGTEFSNNHSIDAYLETLALYRLLAHELLAFQAIVFHGAVLASHGNAYIFTAPSGTGKTTHARLWLQTIPGSYILNGDKPILRVKEDRVVACGTPWCGKEGFGRNELLPVRSICILERATQNSIAHITPHEALPTLIAQTHRPEQQDDLLKVIKTIGLAAPLVKLYRMGCTPRIESALMSYRTMTT